MTPGLNVFVEPEEQSSYEQFFKLISTNIKESLEYTTNQIFAPSQQ